MLCKKCGQKDKRAGGGAGVKITIHPYVVKADPIYIKRPKNSAADIIKQILGPNGEALGLKAISDETELKSYENRRVVRDDVSQLTVYPKINELIDALEHFKESMLRNTNKTDKQYYNSIKSCELTIEPPAMDTTVSRGWVRSELDEHVDFEDGQAHFYVEYLDGSYDSENYINCGAVLQPSKNMRYAYEDLDEVEDEEY